MAGPLLGPAAGVCCADAVPGHQRHHVQHDLACVHWHVWVQGKVCIKLACQVDRTVIDK